MAEVDGRQPDRLLGELDRKARWRLVPSEWSVVVFDSCQISPFLRSDVQFFD